MKAVRPASVSQPGRYGRRLHPERVNSEDGHLLHVSMMGAPGTEQ